MKKTHVFKKSWIKRFVFAAVLIIMLPLKPDDYQAITEDDVKQAERELEAAKQQAQQLDNKLRYIYGPTRLLLFLTVRRIRSLRHMRVRE